jgi:enamine deaminase RidA (YjgF/YER057c/UK114 family)
MPHEAPIPVGLYEPFAIAGDLVALSAISSAENSELITGQVGSQVDLGTAQEAARRAAKNLLAVMRDSAGGDASRIRQVLMVRGYVNAAPDFALAHQVIDAASEVIIAELGERGRHARTAIGCSTLPNRNAVTLDAMIIIGAGR